MSYFLNVVTVTIRYSLNIVTVTMCNLFHKGKLLWNSFISRFTLAYDMVIKNNIKLSVAKDKLWGLKGNKNIKVDGRIFCSFQ